MSTSGRNASRRTWRLIVFTAFLSLLTVGSVQVMLNSAARAAAPAKKPAAAPPADKLPGQIEDDPTVAPDAEESADNNVTFPVDI
jgi:hypothetical protein